MASAFEKCAQGVCRGQCGASSQGCENLCRRQTAALFQKLDAKIHNQSYPVPMNLTTDTKKKLHRVNDTKPRSHSFLQRSERERNVHVQAPEDELAKEMTHDLEMNFNKIAPFGKEDTAKELQDHAAKTQDTLVDAVENAEVAEIKRAVFRA